MATNTRDPRSIITPEAFGIDDALLGIPLARPGRRLVALLIDLVVIGVLTAVTSGLTVFIWGGVGLFLLWVAFNRPQARLGQITSVLFRGSAGCLGLIILVVVLALGFANRVADRVAEGGLAEVEGLEEGGGSLRRALGRVASGVGGAQAMASATTREEAESAALSLLDDFGSLALDFGSASELERDEALQSMVLEAMDSGAPYTDDPEAFAAEMVETWLARSARDTAAGRVEDAAGEGGAGAEGASADSVLSEPALAALRAAVDSLGPADALDRYRSGMEEGRTPETSTEMALLRDRIIPVVAADTVGALEDALARESRTRQRTEERLEETRQALAEEDASFAALLRDIWDQAGSAVGLWSLYFTVTLTLFQGFTLGKRLMGIRVVRLDGHRITWWSAFERAGGYVAGIATGTLGFLQVFWDPNRQCVHDKIGHTAVVMAGADPIQGAVDATWSAGERDGDAPRPGRRPGTARGSTPARPGASPSPGTGPAGS